MEKQKLIAELKEIMPVMDMVEQYDQRLNDIWQKMEIQKSQIKEAYSPQKHVSLPVKIAVVISAWLLYTIRGSWFSIILSTLFVIIAVGYIFHSKQQFERKKEPFRQELGCREQEYEQVEQEMLDELAPHWQKIQDVIPQDYRAPMFVRAAYGYLVNGRADSMKEIVNLFEEEQHRWRMEQGQQQMYEQYQAEIRSLQDATRELELRVSAAEYDASVARASAVKDW